MLRSVLARPHPLLSHLRRHDCRSVALLGRRADQIISQSRSYTSSSEDDTDIDADPPEAKLVAPNCTSPNHRKGHLYVVLDDWKKGFSIHKLDLDDGSDGRDLTLRPPVYRQATECPRWNFAAVGSKIVAVGEITTEGHGKEDNGVTLVYDTETAGMSIVPRLPTALGVPWFLAVATRSGLYALEDVRKKNTQYNVAMHHLEEAPPPPTGSNSYWWGTSDHWSWKSIPSQPPLNTYGMGMMKSIAVHPEGGERTIFVSVGCSDPNRGQTYSYDVQSQEWKDHGDWGLPFHGQADYDTELDAWVGLHNGYERSSNLDGYICSCDVVSPSGSSPRPASKLCKERLFDPNTERPSLLYMGDSTYCMVKIEEQERFKSSRCAGRGNESMICLSMFRLKYNKNGELTITARQPDRSYLFSRYTNDYFQVPAFWM
ncbi:hypothetical protein ACQ4PT_043230 [Festuca glaucescens]